VKLGKVLVASAWPYVNYMPHLGTLVQVLSTDVAARYYRLKGEDVVMVSGSDEHGTPTEVEAVKAGISPKQLTDKNHAKIVELFKKWGFSYDNYTRTENPVHKEFVQKHLMRIYENTSSQKRQKCPTAKNASVSYQTDLWRGNVPTADTSQQGETNATLVEDC